MADQAPSVTARAAPLCFESDRVAAFLKTVEAMAAGQVEERLPVSSRHDELDAIAYAVNVLAGELTRLGESSRGGHRVTDRKRALQQAGHALRIGFARAHRIRYGTVPKRLGGLPCRTCV